MNEIKRFETGKIYYGICICDSGLKPKYVIFRRTKNNVWIEKCGDLIRRKIHIFDNSEMFFPDGQYSMALTIKARREIK